MSVKTEEGGDLRLVRSDDAVHATRELRGVANDPRHDFPEAERDDGEVVAAKAKRGGAEKDAKEGGEEGRGGEQGPDRDVDAELGRRQDGEGVRADGKEGGVAEVEQAGVADHDVQPEREKNPAPGVADEVHVWGVGIDDRKEDQGDAQQEIWDLPFPAGREEQVCSPGDRLAHFSGTRMPNKPVGRKTSTRIRMPKTNTSDHCCPPCMYPPTMATMRPMTKPPTEAPTTLPMPPQTAAVKAKNPAWNPWLKKMSWK